eukprot:scaffold26662_cov35-Phaeocystis_antarctica.AAC.1
MCRRVSRQCRSGVGVVSDVEPGLKLWLAVVTVVPLGVESAVRYRGDDLHPNTRERSCDLVAYATLATLAAAAAACVIFAV